MIGIPLTGTLFQIGCLVLSIFLTTKTDVTMTTAVPQYVPGDQYEKSNQPQGIFNSKRSGEKSMINEGKKEKLFVRTSFFLSYLSVTQLNSHVCGFEEDVSWGSFNN